LQPVKKAVGVTVTDHLPVQSFAGCQCDLAIIVTNRIEFQLKKIPAFDSITGGIESQCCAVKLLRFSLCGQL